MSRASASDLQDPPARPPFMLHAAHRAPVEQALADEAWPSGGSIAHAQLHGQSLSCVGFTFTSASSATLLAMSGWRMDGNSQ